MKTYTQKDMDSRERAIENAKVLRELIYNFKLEDRYEDGYLVFTIEGELPQFEVKYIENENRICLSYRLEEAVEESDERLVSELTVSELQCVINDSLPKYNQIDIKKLEERFHSLVGSMDDFRFECSGVTYLLPRITTDTLEINILSGKDYSVTQESREVAKIKINIEEVSEILDTPDQNEGFKLRKMLKNDTMGMSMLAEKFGDIKISDLLNKVKG